MVGADTVGRRDRRIERRRRGVTTREREALDVAITLRDLALAYWNDGRIEDARRVAGQAAAILREHCPGAPDLLVVLAMRDGGETAVGSSGL